MHDGVPRRVAGGAGLTRRRLLTALAAAPVVLVLPAGCALGDTGSDGPDPLIALAAAARSDAALAAAVAAADPALAERVLPLRDARTEHAAALDAEVARLAPPTTTAPTAAPAPVADATLDALRTAATDSAAAAAAAALDADSARVGLLAAVSACCATYAAVLT